MFKKNDFKNHSISSASIVEDEKGSKDSYISRDLNKKAKNSRKRRQKEKCKNLKKCFGFCDFLSTSWRTFKEFSADTSIHGRRRSSRNISNSSINAYENILFI